MPRYRDPRRLPEEVERLDKSIAELEEKLYSLPVLAEHRKREDKDEWYETRPYVNLPEERRVNSLTAGTLKGPGKLAIPPLVRARHDSKENWVFIHVGRALCGHEGVIHGGLLATLLDETLAISPFERAVFQVRVEHGLRIGNENATLGVRRVGQLQDG